MNRKSLLSLIFAVTLLFSLLAGVTTAQGPERKAEEPGSLPGAAIGAPPEMRGDGAGPTSWAFSGGPNYDSGWVPLALEEARTLTHNLGGNTDNYVVDMQYMGEAFDGINQRYYGGADFGANVVGREDDRVGAYWRSLTDSSITVYRRAEDTYASKVRIRIWVDPVPGWDSGWVSLTPGGPATTLNHGLGRDTDDYVVDMQFRAPGGSGVNQRYYGGADFGANVTGREDDRVGAYWRSLTNASITLFRRAEDDYAGEARVRIWVRPTPTYDSGWVAINQDSAGTLVHNIGGNADDYVVDMQYRTSGASGVNQRYYGGADFGANVGAQENDRVGAYWRSLTDSSITIYRRPEDTYAEQIRIRIWCFWKPPAPDYDSGWVSLAQEEARTLTHNVGGSASDYFVDMQYRGSTFDGVNLRYYGGIDFGANVSGREDDRVSAYWRSLTNSSITVYRRAEDTYALEIRIRIWVMPQPDYDSGWVSLVAGGAATTLNHNLEGDYLDYFVDMQCRSGSGVNQRYYGGADFGANVTGREDERVGAYWRGLDLSSISVYRRPEDTYAEEVRIRIWRVAMPDYESGWQVVSPGSAETLSHNLGGNGQNYLVNMIYYDTDFNYVNARHLGGADFGASPPSGYNADDRVGAYWRALDSSGITVYRRPEDGFADYLRIRIWVTPHQAFLPVVMRNY